MQSTAVQEDSSVSTSFLTPSLLSPPEGSPLEKFSVEEFPPSLSWVGNEPPAQLVDHVHKIAHVMVRREQSVV